MCLFVGIGRYTITVTQHAKRVVKQQSSILLILLLLALLALWWGLSFAHTSATSPAVAENSALAERTLTHTAIDADYPIPNTVLVTHTTIKKGAFAYGGTLVLPNCDTFSTSMSAAGANPAAVSLSFVVTKVDSVCADMGTSSAPFLVSYSDGTAHAPTLANITINNHPVSFSLVKSNK